MKDERSFEEWKAIYLKLKIEDICADMAKRGPDADEAIYGLIWEHIEDNIHDYVEEDDGEG